MTQSRLLTIAAFALSFVVSALAFQGIASAQDARQLFHRGSDAYRQGDYEEAIEAWSAAYAMDPQPLLKYNLGQAYERLAMLPEAIEATETYLSQASPTDSHRADATARLASMRRRLERTGIMVTTNVDGAIIRVDGEEAARSPRRDAIRLSPGSHRISVEHANYQTFRSQVSVPAGRVVEINAELSPGEGVMDVDPALVAAQAQVDDEADSGGGLPLGGWILTGTGGAMLLTGIGLGAAALSAAKDADTSAGSDADGAETKALVADIMIFGGIGVAAGGVLWLLLGGGDSDEDPAQAGQWQVSPVIGGTVVGADARVQF